MTNKQKSAIAAAITILEQSAEKLANEPARAKSEALKAPSQLGTAPFEAGWLGSACSGASKEMRAVIRVISDAFPSAAKLGRVA